jgi:hypothetical protein
MARVSPDPDPAPESFAAVLSAAAEVTPCDAATQASLGVAAFHVRDQAAGVACCAGCLENRSSRK